VEAHAEASFHPLRVRNLVADSIERCEPSLPRSSAARNPQLDRTNLERCTDGFYGWQSNHRPVDNPFVLHDGPPYANGPLHTGHALNKIVKDMILRFRVQQGQRVEYRPGWDCHGLPIELKALGSSNGKSLGAVKIRDRAKRLAAKTVTQQLKEFQSFGVAADWEKRWTTMDPEYELRQLRVFQKMVRGGLIYRKNKPVFWSTSTGTALAEAELEYVDDHTSTAAFVKYPVVSDWSSAPGLSDISGPLYVAIWTTTPWTLPANKAIAIRNDLLYSILRVGSDAVLVGSDRIKSVQKLAPDAEVVKDGILGSQLSGLKYHNKLQGGSAPAQPIIHADFVTADSGTGLVHLAPGHGQDDYDVCSKHGIEAFAPIDDEGHFTADAFPDDPNRLISAPSILDGGGQAVLDIMGDDVLGTHALQHKYPYDWRSKKPVVIRATAQWFADVGSIKDDALETLKSVRFVPESGRSRLENFVKGRSEWCISRQRSWGVPIPALFDESGHAVMTDESIEHIISVMKERTSSAWFSDDPADPAWIAPSLTGKFRRGTDTMDVWFDSGSSWTETPYQADVYFEGTDQHRGWFQSSLLTSLAVQKVDGKTGPALRAPFKTLITHGFTMDGEGRKMSKSIGNTISPEQVMDGSLVGPIEVKTKGKKEARLLPLGTDGLRLWAASSDFTTDVAIGPAVLDPVRRAYTRYRSILKVLVGSLHPEARQAPLTKLDQVALMQLSDAMIQVSQSFENFEFHRGIHLINNWIANDVSAFYLESLKDRLYCGDGGGVIEPIFIGLLRMLAPITPVLVEEAWSMRPQWMVEERYVIAMQSE
jgi:isoleucyl-tRNA synthetase